MFEVTKPGPYKMRNGERVEVVANDSIRFLWRPEPYHSSLSWDRYGFVYNSEAITPHDLIAEWPSHAPADVILPADETPLRVQILNAGATLTHGDRDVEYGPPAVNMAAAGALKAAFRQHMRRDIDPAELEALDMVMTKLGRIATGAPKRDTYIDAATYFAIAGEIALTASEPSPFATQYNPATGE